MLARMKTHIRRPRADYEALYDRKVSERLTYAELAAVTARGITPTRSSAKRSHASG